MKTKKELQELKEKVEALSNELRELDEDELRTVVGGISFPEGMWQIGGGMIFTPTEDISPDTQGNSN